MTHKAFALALILLIISGSVSSAPRKDRRSIVRLETSAGLIRVALSDDTPIHRDNFLKLTASGFYDGILFHRTIRDFMIQAGDPASRNASRGQKLGDGDNGYTLRAEFCLPYMYHWRGALAAAREPDEVNPEMRSSGCQFYLVWGRIFGPGSIRKARAQLEENGIEMTSQMQDDYEMRGGTPHLDGTYTVFGEVIEGLEVVEKIQAVPTDENDRPLDDITIIRATVEQYSKTARKPE